MLLLFFVWISGCYFNIWWGKCYNQCALDWHNIRLFGDIWWRLSDDTITRWHVYGMPLWYSKKCGRIKVLPFGVLLVGDTWQEAKTCSHIWCARLGCLIYLFLWDQIVNPMLSFFFFSWKYSWVWKWPVQYIFIFV